MTLNQIKEKIRNISRNYSVKIEQSRRIFIEERAVSLSNHREIEYAVKSDVATEMNIPYSSVCLCGSAQLGFSPHQETLFEPGVSDLDVACVDSALFQKAWIDIISTTRAFTDQTPFGSVKPEFIDKFKDQILRRGMINIKFMPNSSLKTSWTNVQDELGNKYQDMFGEVSIAIYMNEYAFCWKQQSAVANLMKGA